MNTKILILHKVLVNVDLIKSINDEIDTKNLTGGLINCLLSENYPSILNKYF